LSIYTEEGERKKGRIEKGKKGLGVLPVIHKLGPEERRGKERGGSGEEEEEWTA